MNNNSNALRRAVAAVVTLALGAILVPDARASGAGSAEAGQRLAEQLCARCHAIEGAGPGPAPEAPAFARIARQWPPDHLREAFAEGIMVGHGPVEMPSFELEPDLIDDLVAYLNELTGK